MADHLTADEKKFLHTTLDGMIEGFTTTRMTIDEAAICRAMVEMARNIQGKLPRMETASD